VTPAGIATVLVSADASLERVLPWRPGIPNGAGDLFAGLWLGRLLNGEPAAEALSHGLADLDRVLAASEHRSCLALAALLMGSPQLG
jgi:pyridoxal/pyridoxine/pyridoxamine kinase